MKVVIVGGGIIGLCTALSLVDLGVDVEVVDQDGNESGSSSGATRMFRPPYPTPVGGSEFFGAARCEFETLCDRLSEDLLVPTLCVEFEDPTAPKFGALHAALGDQQVPYDDAVPQFVDALFPHHHLVYGRALVRQDCAVINASATMNGLRRVLEQRGVSFVRARVHGVEELGDVVHVLTDQGPRMANSVVIAAGCWTPGLIPSNPAIAMWATEESVFHVDANRELPIFNDARLFSYLGALNGGFSATLETRKHIRIIERTGGTKILPGVRSYRAREDAQIRCGQFLTALFPEVGWTIRSSTCCYEWTSDYKPIVGRVPGREHVWVCSSFTGGGFKLGPLLGDYMAQSVTSNEVHEGLAAFDPNRG